jgi:hypothetical protein
MKDGDLIACHKCDGKGFRYVESIYHERNSWMPQIMVDVVPEDCETCNAKGIVIVSKEKENAKC